MADTPADKPTRRRTTKATGTTAATTPKPKRRTTAVAKPAAAAAAAPAEAKAAPAETKPAAPAKTPRKSAATKTQRKTATAKASSRPIAAPKPRRAPRKAAAPRAKASPTPSPTPAAAASPVQKLVERARDALPEAPPRAGLFAALGTLAALGGAFFVWRAARADEPNYQVLESDGSMEIRRYPAMVTAGTEQRGKRQTALSDGFRVLADYIFAKSRPGEKLAMTAPVLADSDGSGSWRTRFIMPAGKARSGLPETPAGVDLVSEPSARVAAIRFSGRADDADLELKENALRSWLQLKSLPHEGRAVHAFYNAPITPGALRRNEVLVVLSEDGGMG